MTDQTPAPAADGTLELLLDDLAFPESPRWHDGALWLSDMHDPRVLRVAPDGSHETIARFDAPVSGLGFLPDGTPLVVSMHDRRVLRLEPGGPVPHAELDGIASWHANDMHVDGRGRAYVGNYGDASVPPAPPRPASIALIDETGRARTAAEGLEFPNGMAITADGGTLLVAETRSVPPRITAFAIGPDGGLSNRRTWASLDGTAPDGVCLDAEGGLWVASPFTAEVVHLDRDGRITQRIATGHGAYSVALGGPSGHDLFVCTARDWVPAEAIRSRSGAVRRLRVAVPAA